VGADPAEPALDQHQHFGGPVFGEHADPPPCPLLYEGCILYDYPKIALKPEVEFEWKIPKWSNAIERDRARTYFQAYAAAVGLYCCEKAMAELHAGRTDTFTPFTVPDETIGCGFHETVRGVLSHHLVIRNK